MRWASKPLCWSTPKSNANTPVDFPADYSFILSHYLCRAWIQHQTHNHQVLHLLNPKGFPAHWGKHFSALFREAKKYTKLSTVIKSHANKAKALCCNLLQIRSEVFNTVLGLGSGQHVNKDKRKTALTSGNFTYIGHVPVTLNMEAMVLFLLNQNGKQCKVSTANVDQFTNITWMVHFHFTDLF